MAIIEEETLRAVKPYENKNKMDYVQTKKKKRNMIVNTKNDNT